MIDDSKLRPFPGADIVDQVLVGGPRDGERLGAVHVQNLRGSIGDYSMQGFRPSTRMSTLDEAVYLWSPPSAG